MMVTVSSAPILTQTFGSKAPAASAVLVSRKPGTYPPTSSAPPAALTFKKVRLVSVFVICHLPIHQPRDEWRGGCVDMFRTGRYSPTSQHRCPRRWASVSWRAGRRPTSIVPIGNSRTEALARQSRQLATHGWRKVKDLRLL